MIKLVRVKRILALGAFGLYLGSCATGGGVYSDPTEEQILGDKWNNSDANKTAQYMIDSVTTAAWIDEYVKVHKGEKPIVIVDEVENRTDEHIDTKALTEAIRSQLINSRKVRFVDAAKRQKILDELKYQHSGAVAKETAKKKGAQIGAAYLLGGGLSNIVDTKGDYKTVTYQVDMTLTNIETAEIEWNGQNKIKKSFKR
ncbi:MAG: penicillin-binding protein activator LpoB [Oligoflexales bacterium]